MLSETKIKMLLALIEAKRITIANIKDPAYKAEIEARLSK